MFSRLTNWWVRFVRTHYTPRLALCYNSAGLSIYYHQKDALKVPPTLPTLWELKDGMRVGVFEWNGVEILVELPDEEYTAEYAAYINYLGKRFPMAGDCFVVTELYPSGAKYLRRTVNYVGRNAGLAFWQRMLPWECTYTVRPISNIRARERVAENAATKRAKESATPGKEWPVGGVKHP